jgi:hypothetical protein
MTVDLVSTDQPTDLERPTSKRCFSPPHATFKRHAVINGLSCGLESASIVPRSQSLSESDEVPQCPSLDRSRYLLWSLHLHPARRLLLEGDRPLRLGTRALDILIALTEHAGGGSQGPHCGVWLTRLSRSQSPSSCQRPSSALADGERKSVYSYRCCRAIALRPNNHHIRHRTTLRRQRSAITIFRIC